MIAAVLDGVEFVRARLWPRRFAAATPYAFILPAFVLVGVLVVGLGYMVDASFRPFDRSQFRLLDEFTLENYRELGQRSVYLLVLWRSALAALIVTAVCLALAFPYAYAMVRTPSGAMRKFLLFSLFLPFFIGQVVRAYGWLIILGHQGLMNGLLGLVDIEPVRVLFTYPAVILGLVQYMLPFAVLLIAPAITAIPQEMEMASESLGAGWVRTFRHVVLPMAKPGLAAATVVVFTISLTEYAIPEILGGGTNDFIANAIYDAFFQNSDSALGSALSIVLVLIGSFIVAVLFALMGAGATGLTRRAAKT